MVGAVTKAQERRLMFAALEYASADRMYQEARKDRRVVCKGGPTRTDAPGFDDWMRRATVARHYCREASRSRARARRKILTAAGAYRKQIDLDLAPAFARGKKNPAERSDPNGGEGTSARTETTKTPTSRARSTVPKKVRQAGAP